MKVCHNPIFLIHQTFFKIFPAFILWIRRGWWFDKFICDVISHLFQQNLVEILSFMAYNHLVLGPILQNSLVVLSWFKDALLNRSQLQGPMANELNHIIVKLTFGLLCCIWNLKHGCYNMNCNYNPSIKKSSDFLVTLHFSFLVVIVSNRVFSLTCFP
jgi:hypothetical protein